MVKEDFFMFDVGKEGGEEAILKLAVKTDGGIKDVVASSAMNLRALALNAGNSWCFNLSSDGESFVMGLKLKIRFDKHAVLGHAMRSPSPLIDQEPESMNERTANTAREGAKMLMKRTSLKKPPLVPNNDD